MAAVLPVYTIGGGDLLQSVFQAVAAVFQNKTAMQAITQLGMLFGGFSAIVLFSSARDLTVLMKWAGLYVLVTSLMLYPKATVMIEDMTGKDIRPRMVDNVPLSLAVFASFTSRIGQGFTEMMETVFHMPDDVSYQKAGMLMGSKLVFVASNFQITDPDFLHTLNEFMQQCVFYDLLMNKYTTQELMRAENPWRFIKERTSQARAFPLNGEITVCKEGALKLDHFWSSAIANAASVYGAQILGKHNHVSAQLLARLQSSYRFLTNVSQDGAELLQSQLLTNVFSGAISQYGAKVNAPAAVQAYQDTKTELQNRMTLDATGRQAGIWLQHFKNIIEAVLYSAFIIIYFLSYFPFGVMIVRNYLTGMFFIQSLAPMYAIIHYAASFFAQSKSTAFLVGEGNRALSMNSLIGITQANADAIALAGYLMWPVTIGAAIMIFRGMPAAIQGMGQYLGGVSQQTASSVAAETVGGNISLGNSSIGNRSAFNTNANHFDANGRYASGMMSMQTGSGSMVSIAPDGHEIMDNRGATSSLGVSVHVAENTRAVATQQAQASATAVLQQSQAAGEQYGAALRQVMDYSHHQHHGLSSGTSYSQQETSGASQSFHKVAQLVESFAKDHHVSHERAAQILAQVYADAKVGGGVIGSKSFGISGSLSGSARSSAGSLYSEAERYAKDQHFNEAVDTAKRAAAESHFREASDSGNRYAKAIASSFDRGDSFRQEAASSLSRAESYATLASTSQENAATINANYAQEFYGWMQKKPSIYGHGTMSRSMIDEMMVNNPTQARAYADEFVQEKTAATIKAFNESHHLTNGDAHVRAAHASNNQSVAGVKEVQAQQATFDRAVQHQHGNTTHAVDGHTKEQVVQTLQNNRQTLDHQQRELQGRTSSKTTRIQEKVKGQVLGSLNVVRDAKKKIQEWTNNHDPS